jgi:hypothetical protein
MPVHVGQVRVGVFESTPTVTCLVLIYAGVLYTKQTSNIGMDWRATVYLPTYWSAKILKISDHYDQRFLYTVTWYFDRGKESSKEGRDLKMPTVGTYLSFS